MTYKRDLVERTETFVDLVLGFVNNLPDNTETRIISDQLIRSASSVGANYRAAKRAKSDKDYINKLKIVEEETDETMYWLEIIERRKITSGETLAFLIAESNELIAMFISCIKKARLNTKNKNRITDTF